MRQLSTRIRWAAVTALTIAASTGCMSVGDDAGDPSPSRQADRKGASARPDGDTVSGSGRSGSGGGRTEAQSDRGASSGRPDAKSSGRGASAGPADPRPVPGVPGVPEPTRGGPLPTPEPSAPGPGEPPAPPATQEPPPPSPEPEPSQPPEPPSASPAAQFHNGANRARDGVRTWPTPRVSPQLAPA